eukprot:scaffold28474_cov74-Skeletonema_dohrnii-CCMP3373.AAC.1
MSKDPDHGGRVYFLACSEDLKSMTEIDAYRHEYAVPFMLSPDDLSTNRCGKINVDSVRFSFTGLDGTDIDEIWFLNEMSFNECIDGVVEIHFGEDELEDYGFLSDEEKETKQAESKEYLEQQHLRVLAIKSKRLMTHSSNLLNTMRQIWAKADCAPYFQSTSQPR